MSNPDDESLFRLVIGDSPELAAVHKTTGCLDDIIWTRDDATVFDTWQSIYRVALERDGLISELDFETKCFANSDSLDDFARASMNSRPIDPASGLTLVDTDQFGSRQEACSRVEGCTGWWRFTGVGYNQDGSQAILHTDYEHPKYSLMGTGHFVLLERVDSVWSVVAKHMTWIS